MSDHLTTANGDIFCEDFDTGDLIRVTESLTAFDTLSGEQINLRERPMTLSAPLAARKAFFIAARNLKESS